MLHQAIHHFGQRSAGCLVAAALLPALPSRKAKQTPAGLGIRRRLEPALEADRRKNLAICVDGIRFAGQPGTPGAQELIESQQRIFTEAQKPQQMQPAIDAYAGELEGGDGRVFNIHPGGRETAGGRWRHRAAEQFGAAQGLLGRLQRFLADHFSRSRGDDACAVC